MFGWFKSELRERQKKVRQDRKHLEERVRRFLKSYLDADQKQKPQYYRAVEDISKKCQPAELSLSQPDKDDRRFAEATSRSASQMVLDRVGRSSADDKVDDFVTDACATVAVAYHRAAGVYVADEKMNELGICSACSPLNVGNVVQPCPEEIAGHPVGSTKLEGEPSLWSPTGQTLRNEIAARAPKMTQCAVNVGLPQAGDFRSSRAMDARPTGPVRPKPDDQCC